jgi:hypothetical protein
VPRFGEPLNIRVRSSESVAIIEPVLGLDQSQPSVDAPLGTTPSSDNYIMREGGLEPRPMLSPRNTSAQIMGNIPILGLHELISVNNSRYPIASGTTRWAVYGQAGTPNGWSVLSYVSSNGVNDPPAGANTDYWDFTQIYYPTRDENLAVGGNGSYQTLYCTESNTTVFSSLTGAPKARHVASLDNYLIAFNLREGTNDYVQRVQWSDRGSPSAWTTGLSGFEDLLSMKGQGTRIVTHDNKLILFSDAEIWQGIQRDFPFTWSFAPYDTSRGCPYSWTIAQTPAGLMFLAKDYQVYLLPKGGGPAQAIGQRLHRTIRNSLDRPERAWAVYDNTYSQYQLHYPIKGGSGRPQRAVFLDINSGSWAPQSFDRSGGNLSVTRGTEINLSSSATTWGGAGAASVRWADVGASYAEYAGASEERAVLMGSSNGTLYYLNSAATSDNGTAVECRWQSTGLLGDDPSHQKTITGFRVDYQTDSASSLTVRFSQNVGGSFGIETRLDLPSTSGISQAIAYPYFSSRFPAFEISSQGQRHRLFRFFLEFRRGGR